MRKHNIWKKGLYAMCALLAAGVIYVQSGFVSMAYPETGVINDTGVNIRSTSDSGRTDNVMKKADQNMEVTVLDEETGTDGKTWLKISYTDNGTERIGYVREDFVTLSGENTGNGEGTEGTAQEMPEENGGAETASKNPEGLTPIEGLNDSLTCYLDIDQAHFYINQSFTDDMIPDGFYRTEVAFRNDTIQVAKSNDIEFYIVYLTNYDDQTTSDWYVYDAEAQGFCYWIKLQTMQGKYLYLLDTFGGARMDFGYNETTLEIDGKIIQAWQLDLSEEEDLTGENKDFYYVYGINQSGNKGLYSYYAADGTYQRNILTGLEIVDDEYLSTEENTKLLETQLKELKAKYTEDMSRRFTIICILIVVCVLLLFIVIHVSLKARKGDVDDEDDDSEDEEEERPKFRRRGVPVTDRRKTKENRSDVEQLIADELGDEEPEQEVELDEITLEDISDTIPQEKEDFSDSEEDEGDEEENGEEEDEDDEDEEYVRPKRRGFFFGRHRDDEEDDDDEEEDDEEEDDEEEDEDDEDEEYVRPKRRGFFFGRHRDDEEDDDDNEEEDDEDAYIQKANRKSRAADYAEKTVSARKSSRAPAPTSYDDDEFEFEFIDLDDEDDID